MLKLGGGVGCAGVTARSLRHCYSQKLELVCPAFAVTCLQVQEHLRAIPPAPLPPLPIGAVPVGPAPVAWIPWLQQGGGPAVRAVAPPLLPAAAPSLGPAAALRKVQTSVKQEPAGSGSPVTGQSWPSPTPLPLPSLAAAQLQPAAAAAAAAQARPKAPAPSGRQLLPEVRPRAATRRFTSSHLPTQPPVGLCGGG